jgi:hypothetical protein
MNVNGVAIENIGSYVVGLGYYSAAKSASFDFGDAFQVVSLLSVAANNIVSTLLIAGRIW